MNRVVVSGATSMMGIAFLNQCIKKHVQVLALVRPKSTKLSFVPKSDFIQIVECDIKDMTSLEISGNFPYDVFSILDGPIQNMKTEIM